MRIYIPGTPDVKMRPRATKNGRMYDPNAQAKEASIQKAQITGNDRIFTGPMSVEFTFVFPRPRSHFRTGKFSNVLRADAPFYCVNSKDVDNMEKFYSDSFNCIAWVDDRQIVRSSAHKRWCEFGEQPHVLITAYEYEPWSISEMPSKDI